MKIKELLIMFAINIFVVALVALVIYNNAKADNLNSSEEFKTEEFEYKGHQYIKFDNGVVHNPECKKCIMIYD